MNREEWLTNAINELRADFAPVAPIPASIRVTCGWPSKSALAAKKRRVAECWYADCSADNHVEIFVSPYLSDMTSVLGVLVHELVHAAVGAGAGHGPIFRAAAVALGLTGKMTATEPGPTLTERLHTLAEKLGPYPHATLGAMTDGRKKQGTRMIKLECPVCGYVCRTTQKWLDVGTPTCPCGTIMEP